MSVTSETRTYRLDHALLVATGKRFMRRQWAKALAVLVIALLLGAVFVYSNSPKKLDHWMAAVPFMLTFFAVIPPMAFHALMKSKGKALAFYQLELDENAVRASTAKGAMEALRTEIKSITETKGQGLVIATARRRQAVVIPEQLIGYSDAREQLSQWKTITPRRLPGQASSTFFMTMFAFSFGPIALGARDVRIAMVGLALVAFSVVEDFSFSRAPTVPGAPGAPGAPSPRSRPRSSR